MAQTKLGDTIVNTSGNLPSLGGMAPDFTLAANDLTDITLKSFSGKNVVMNIFPSIDTRVCAMSVREFNKRAAEAENTVVLCISKDLPYAFKRFCGAEGIENVVTLSDFRNKGFSKDYGVGMLNGKMEGLHARAIVVVDPNGKVKYTELVPLIGQEPDYDQALKAIKG
jgi:thiol peroxidase